MKRHLRASRLVPLVVVIGALLTRIPVLRNASVHKRELLALIGKPGKDVFPELWLKAESGRPDVQVGYVYAEACPYCSIDRVTVQGAINENRDVVARFIAIRIGPTLGDTGYWTGSGVVAPDRVVSVTSQRASEFGITAVPLLVLLHDGRIVAAWEGALRWRAPRLALAIRCRIGQRRACVRGDVEDIAASLGRRFNWLTGAVAATVVLDEAAPASDAPPTARGGATNLESLERSAMPRE